MNPRRLAILLRHGTISGELECALRERGLLNPGESLVREKWKQLNARLELFPHPKTRQKRPWPAWASALADYRLPDDRGVGDTVEKTIGLFGSDAFQFWFHQTFGHNRHCPKCPAKWNRLYPYEKLGARS